VRPEIIAKLKDPSWRISHLYKIVTKDGRLKTFKPNYIQDHLNKNDSQKKIILKARQFGISTNEILKCLDYCIWNRNRTVVILAHEHDAIKKLFRIVRRAVDNMHPDIRPLLDKGGGSKYEIFFPEINSRIYCDLESRGDTIHKLHVSEMAFMKDPERLRATLQAVPLDGEVGIETTPNGMNHFYDYYFDKSNDNYKRFFFPWFFHDEYQIPTKKISYSQDERALIAMAKKLFDKKITKEQIAWFRMKKSEIKEMVYQEYPSDEHSCFLSSGDPAINLHVIDQLMKNAKKPLKEDNGLKIYKYAQKGGFYVIGADTAEGVGGDYSVAHVYNAVNRELVATFRDHIRPYDFAHKLNEIGKLYTRGIDAPPLLAVERNNHGHAVLLELKENINYKNLFFDTDERVGWITNKVSRPIMINAFIEAIETNKIIVNDLDLLKECMTLVNNKGKIEAVEGKHDDTIIASSIALQMVIASSSISFYNEISSKILI